MSLLLLLIVVLCPHVVLVMSSLSWLVVPSFHVFIVVLSLLVPCRCHVTAGDMAPGFSWVFVGVHSVVSQQSHCLL